MPALATLVILVCLFALPSGAQAVMPPHITASTPEPGGVLTSDTILLEGYTLYRPEPGQLVVTDTTTGLAAPWEVVDLQCSDEGDWQRAETDDGAIQFACKLFIRLVDPHVGHAFELTFLEWEMAFTYSPGQ